MIERITGGGTTDGEYFDIKPVKYKRGHREYALVKRIAELEDIHKRLLNVTVVEEDTYYGSTKVSELIGLEDDLKG